MIILHGVKMTTPIDRERAGFLATIRADPNNDAPRMIYADWLDEQGDTERAEFIRVQCELARPIGGPPCQRHKEGRPPFLSYCPECRRLRRRERDLFQADDARTLSWFGLPQPWARIVRPHPFSGNGTDYPYAVCRRGFIYSLTCTAADWLAHADAILREHPVREVRLTTWPDAKDYAEHNRQVPRFWETPWSVALTAEWPGIKFTLPS